MSTKINNYRTDTPLLDEVYYNCEIMARGTVLKDEDEANKQETIATLKNANRYILAVENKAKWYLYDYTEEDIRLQIPDITDEKLDEYMEDNKLIPDFYKNKLLTKAKEDIIENYEEMNNYYRCLNGLPNLYETGIYISSINLTAVPLENMIDLSKTFLHELSATDIETLKTCGILDKVKADYPKDRYLKYLGSNKISPYTARKAAKFAALQITTPTSSEVYSRYCYFLEKNRVYTLKALYNSAFKYNSPYYDKLMMIMIIIETIVDCISEIPEYYIRKDFFDERTVRFILESNGIDYFEDIPLKYQIAMCKNLNLLIKYSGSDKCIVDICSLFGFDNIEIFKYYLLKERKTDEFGKHVFPLDSEGNPSTDLDELYELKFIKVPLDDIADDYIKDNTHVLSYDNVTSGDKYWNGIYSSDYVRKKILEKEFSIELSKYISIDTLFELSDMSFDIPYLINLIMFSDTSKDRLMITVNALSDTTSFNIVDLFIYLYALMYVYLGVEDRIHKSATEIASVKGFNFDVDLPTLYNYLRERGTSFEALGVPKYEIPRNDEITSFNQLVNIFVKNKNIYKIITNGMKEANNKHEYELYKILYDSFFVTDLSWECYNIPEGNNDYTYTDFLSTKNVILYNSIITFKSIGNLEVRKNKIASIMNSVVNAIESAVNGGDFIENAFSNLPTVSVDYVKVYLNKVINFFKSYKLTVLDINTIYKFDDKLDNRIFIIDAYSDLISTFDKFDIVEYIDKITALIATFDIKEYMPYYDLITDMTRLYWRYWEDRVDITDTATIKSIKLLEDYFNPINYDKVLDPNKNYTLKDIIIQIIYTFEIRDNCKLLDDILGINVLFNKKETIDIAEDIFISKTYN